MKGPFTYLNLSFKNIKLKYLDFGLSTKTYQSKWKQGHDKLGQINHSIGVETSYSMFNVHESTIHTQFSILIECQPTATMKKLFCHGRLLFENHMALWGTYMSILFKNITYIQIWLKTLHTVTTTTTIHFWTWVTKYNILCQAKL
jgi:hypothetical protein